MSEQKQAGRTRWLCIMTDPKGKTAQSGEGARHPIQPLVKDSGGVMRFKPNAIVAYLLDRGPISMNDLARMQFPDDDRQQFAQLIGYSLSGYSELRYVSDEAYSAAQNQLTDHQGGETE